MIELIPGLPDNVVGLDARGEVTGDDYERVVIPTVEEKRKRHGKIRLLYVLSSEFEGFSAAAMWDDTKVGMGHPFSWERVAMVTDHDVYRRLIKGWGFLIPGKVRSFKLAKQDEARSWITEAE